MKNIILSFIIIFIITGCGSAPKKDSKPLKINISYDGTNDEAYENLLLYIAEKDMSLEEIGKRYNISHFDIMKINSMNDEKIKKGDKVYIPFVFTDTELFYPFKDTMRIDISSPYGMRNHPVYEKFKFHAGVDLRVPLNTEILACGDGIVQFAGPKGAYGNYIEIAHEGGYITAYSHMNSICVRVNDVVKKGDIIGYAGKTGNATGVHLHLEVKKNGKNLNPAFYIKELKMNIVFDMINGVLEKEE